MATIFPANPTVGQIYNGYQWNGVAWATIGLNAAINYVTSTQFASHTGATTSVHGITDTSLLALSEIASAINNDASFSSTVTSALNLKAPKDSPTFTTGVTVNGSVNATSYLQNGQPLQTSSTPTVSPFLFLGI